MLRRMALGAFVCLACFAACGDDETGSGGASGATSTGDGGSSSDGGSAGGGGGAACLDFGLACTSGDTCCDYAGATGECFAFGNGPKCTIPCPADPADCPNANGDCNGMGKCKVP